MMRRACGILLHITSLPGRYGIGDIGPGAFRFVDFLSRGGQTVWQILPVNPVSLGMGCSPYSALSAFAGNPFLISPEQMVKDGFVHRDEIRSHPAFPDGPVNYGRVESFKNRLLAAAYQRWKSGPADRSLVSFCRDNRFWLDDYTLFMALRGRFGSCWWKWPDAVRDRRRKSMETLRAELDDAIRYEIFVQYVFFHQWNRLKSYANERAVKIIGDLPMYVAHDSADVWAHRHSFKLTRSGMPRVVGGVPPDYFSKEGQRWGSPLYDWVTMRKDGYRWWMNRLKHNLSLFDRLRLDHFRGFVDYWQIPGEDETAVGGRWVKGPGADILTRIKRRFGAKVFIVEDLGDISDEVRAAIDRFSLTGMRVLQFAFGKDFPKGPHLPEHYPADCVVYTGTHDNNTTLGWFGREVRAAGKRHLQEYLGRAVRRSQIHRELVRLAMESRANVCIVPMQDILGLNGRARMNKPGTVRGNWGWRMKNGVCTGRLADRLARAAKACGRA